MQVNARGGGGGGGREGRKVWTNLIACLAVI